MQNSPSQDRPADDPLGIGTRLLLRSLEPYTSEVARGFEALRQDIAALQLRLDEIQGGFAHAQADAQRRAEDAQDRIDQVVGHLAETTRGLQRVEAVWSSPMYMTDADAFRLPEAEGGGLGFRTNGPAAGAQPDAFYRAFEDVFRGPPEHVRALQQEYLALLPGGGLIADIGCGRGEFLSLLAESGTDRIGVDMDADMAAVAADRGDCEVRVGDGTEWLLAQEEGSLAGVFAAQVIEHMTANQIEVFLRAAFRALDPEHGVLIAETVNPYFIPAFRMFWVDLTHQCLIYPEVALALARATGFASGDIHFPGGTGNADFDRAEIGAYALIARRGGERRRE
jgi:SAM-dependent methyltransferase